jgi:serine/threonine-protein kinase
MDDESGASEQPDPLIGAHFGNYVVEKLLGQGGMGAVYRAVQPDIGKQVAIKFLAPQLAAAPELVQRFFAEARAVNLIQHDNIVDIFDFASRDGHSYFVMELLKGRSLEEVLGERGRLAVGRAIDICSQVADAITAAHEHNIVHRDLKPDNIFLLTKSGREDFVKLLDFGIAKLTDPEVGKRPQTMSGAILGTPGYMSPEQGTGGVVDGRTDIYALGVLAYRMLSGRLPFEGNTFLEILNKQLLETPPDLSTLRPELELSLSSLVMQMIDRDPARRPQLMAEVCARLGAEFPADFERPVTGRIQLHTSSGPVLLTHQKMPVAPAPEPALELEAPTAVVFAVDERSIARPARRRTVGAVVGVGLALGLSAAGLLWLARGRSASPTVPVAAARPIARPAPVPVAAPVAVAAPAVPVAAPPVPVAAPPVPVAAPAPVAEAHHAPAPHGPPPRSAHPTRLPSLPAAPASSEPAPPAPHPARATPHRPSIGLDD